MGPAGTLDMVCGFGLRLRYIRSAKACIALMLQRPALPSLDIFMFILSLCRLQQ